MSIFVFLLKTDVSARPRCTCTSFVFSTSWTYINSKSIAQDKRKLRENEYTKSQFSEEMDFGLISCCLMISGEETT